MRMQSLKEMRLWVSAQAMLPEAEVIANVVKETEPFLNKQSSIFSDAAFLLKRSNAIKPSNMEQLLGHFSLSSKQGVELMRMMEALPRIPDTETAQDLISEIFSNPCWEQDSSTKTHLLNDLADAGLKFAHQIIGAPKGNVLQQKMRQMSLPIFHKTLRNMGNILGNGFILAETIKNALKKTKKGDYLYSFDMLGEAAKTNKEAEAYFSLYMDAINATKQHDSSKELYFRNGISVKLSALYPRFELTHRKGVVAVLLPRLKKLCLAAKKANITLTIDAEESRRLDLTLELYEMLLADQEFAGFDGIGIVIQAYHKRAMAALEYLTKLAKETGKKLPVRLVKGAYWDSEIKVAQELGLVDYPVFTHKSHTDLSYLACARKMLDHPDQFWPQFATHNAHSICAILHYATPLNRFEFQKLYGMANRIHEVLKEDHLVRIYAPVGGHEALLPYLIRRLLENGANSSFLHQLEQDIDDQELLAFPQSHTSPALPLPAEIYGSERTNSTGIDLGHLSSLQALRQSLAPFSSTRWLAMPVVNNERIETGEISYIASPSNIHATTGTSHFATEMEAMQALTLAENGFKEWSGSSVETRAEILDKAADILETRAAEAYALLVYEAGKILPDAIVECRETVDFLRYYAELARRTLQPTAMHSIIGETNVLRYRGRGIFLCISPWNFPLAIFAGQIAAALVAGNTVIAKPAEQTPLIAAFMTSILIEAGLPPYALQLLPGSGERLGRRLVNDPKLSGVVFTGSSQTAQFIQQDLAKRNQDIIPLIAETGGQNAMIMDSSILPEQTVDDVLNSAFGSSGQRCSALRVLYVPNAIADSFIRLLKGAAAERLIGFPEDLDTDISSVINPEAQQGIYNHLEAFKEKILFQIPVPALAGRKGCFVPPTVIELDSINDLEREIFGPVLHIIRYDWSEIDRIISEINNTGYALTFGIQSRLEGRIDYLAERIEAGNIYINRTMTGAVVGQQPFGGHGLSGTGLKAGGPNYLTRFITEIVTTTNTTAMGGNVDLLLEA